MEGGGGINKGEINNYITVWVSAFASLTYCFIIGKITAKPLLRLLAILPVICLFLILPLSLRSVLLGAHTSFFLVWVANFKLLLFAFGKSTFSSPLSFPTFIAITCLPIKIKQNPSPDLLTSTKNGHTYYYYTLLKSYSKQILLASIFPYIKKENYFHPNVTLFLYCIHLYLSLRFLLAMVRNLVWFLMGIELEPHFNKPYLSTSIQDFWGRRWNLMISDILRSTVYDPMRSICGRLIGSKWAKYPAILATFFVSGVMHVVLLYYLGRQKPKWDVLCYFLLHGMCVNVEILLKSSSKNRRGLPVFLAAPLVVAFAAATAVWLFLPALLSLDLEVKGRNEVIATFEYVKNIVII